MVSLQSLYSVLDQSPFQPFQIVLNSGEVIDIRRQGQAAANPRGLFLGGDRDVARRVKLEEIDHVQDRPITQ